MSGEPRNPSKVSEGVMSVLPIHSGRRDLKKTEEEAVAKARSNRGRKPTHKTIYFPRSLRGPKSDQCRNDDVRNYSCLWGVGTDWKGDCTQLLGNANVLYANWHVKTGLHTLEINSLSCFHEDFELCRCIFISKQVAR